MTKWTQADIPGQHGRTAIVTGTGGLGFEDALALARAGAFVVIAGRSDAKGAEALQMIRKAVPAAQIRFERLDLASLASIAAFAARIAEQHEAIDILINNAGVMVPPHRKVTLEGFELQFGTNYLGHFALTAHLLPLLRKDARIIALSSVAARAGVIDFDNLNSTRGYAAMRAYSQSKLACLMFALELQRRSDALGWGIRSIASQASASIVRLGGATARPCSSFTYHSTLIPAASATSSRRKPGVRRLRSVGRPSAVGSSRSRLERRNVPRGLSAGRNEGGTILVLWPALLPLVKRAQSVSQGDEQCEQLSLRPSERLSSWRRFPIPCSAAAR